MELGVDNSGMGRVLIANLEKKARIEAVERKDFRGFIRLEKENRDR